jgi:hypothetical protein
MPSAPLLAAFLCAEARGTLRGTVQKIEYIHCGRVWSLVKDCNGPVRVHKNIAPIYGRVIYVKIYTAEVYNALCYVTDGAARFKGRSFSVYCGAVYFCGSLVRMACFPGNSGAFLHRRTHAASRAAGRGIQRAGDFTKLAGFFAGPTGGRLTLICVCFIFFSKIRF